MKRFGIVTLLALVAGIAWAAVGPTNIDNGGRWSKSGIWIGTSTTETAVQAHRQAKRLGGSATIDFTSQAIGSQDSSNITVTGAAVGDLCTVSAPAAASALKATFNCYVTATDTVVVRFTPENKTKAQVALSSGTPSTATATVAASSICTCTPVGATAAIAAAGCATGVSSTTLTLTGPNTVTTTMTYDCAAPVDPASGTYYVALERNGS